MSTDNPTVKDLGIAAGGLGWLLLVIAALILLPLWGCPHYHVYQQEMAGLAKLKEAESSKQILLEGPVCVIRLVHPQRHSDHLLEGISEFDNFAMLRQVSEIVANRFAMAILHLRRFLD